MGQLLFIFIAGAFVFFGAQALVGDDPAWLEGGMLTGLLVVGGVLLSMALGLLLHKLIFGRRNG